MFLFYLGRPDFFVIQLSIAIGSTIGGIMFDSLGWQSAFVMSATLLLGAVTMTVVTSRQARQAC